MTGASQIDPTRRDRAPQPQPRDQAPQPQRPGQPPQAQRRGHGPDAEPSDQPGGRERTVARVADRILRTPPKNAGTRIVAVDGQSGAGKTTFAAALAVALQARGATVAVVHTDDLLDGWDDQFTFWDRLLEQVVNPLRHKEPAAYRRYDWVRERFDQELTPVPPADIVIIEGVSAARAEMRRVADLTVFLNVSEDEAWRRLRDRDPADAMPFLVAWKAREGRHFAADRTAEQVDVVVGDEIPPSAP